MVRIKGSVFSHRCSLVTFYFNGSEKMSRGQFHNQKMQWFVDAQASLINVINTAVIIMILYSRIHTGQRLQSSGTSRFVSFSLFLIWRKVPEFPPQFFSMRKRNGRIIIYRHEISMTSFIRWKLDVSDTCCYFHRDYSVLSSNLVVEESKMKSL